MLTKDLSKKKLTFFEETEIYMQVLNTKLFLCNFRRSRYLQNKIFRAHANFENDQDKKS